MRHHRLDLLRPRSAVRVRRTGRDDRDDGVPRPRRQRHVLRRPGRPGAPQARHHRPAGRPSADDGPDPAGRRGDGVLRRGVQLPRAQSRTGRSRTPVHDRLRHRGRAPRVPGVGGRGGRAAQRDVRLRRVGRPHAETRDDPRPHGHQALLLRPHGGRRAVRLRAEGDPRQSSRPARGHPGRAA